MRRTVAAIGLERKPPPPQRSAGDLNANQRRHQTQTNSRRLAGGTPPPVLRKVGRSRYQEPAAEFGMSLITRVRLRLFRQIPARWQRRASGGFPSWQTTRGAAAARPTSS